MNNRGISFLFCAVAFTASGVALGQTLVPHTFEAGQPARAAEVNENFSALETAVNDNESAIQDNAAAIAALSSGDVTILDLTDPDACTIDVPGYYVLDRNWLNTPRGDSEPPYGCGIMIVADATLDFRGFQIDGGEFWPGDQPVLRVATGSFATLRNGRIRGKDAAIGAPEATVRLEEMVIVGRALLGDGTVLRSRLFGNSEVDALQIRGTAIVRDSDIHCTVPCIAAGPGTAEIVNNRVTGDLYPTIVITGSGGIVRGNVITGTVLVDSNAEGNIVGWNILDGSIDVIGGANVLENNIVRGDVSFTMPGNFYGDNRITGTFQGTAGQTDWGGNVSF